jgi:hypothetical protein
MAAGGVTAAAPKLPQDKPEIKPEILDHANHIDVSR